MCRWLHPIVLALVILLCTGCTAVKEAVLPPTATPTATATSTPTLTATPTFTATPTDTVTPSLTPTDTSTPTPTSTPTDTATPTLTPTATSTLTPTPAATATPAPPANSLGVSRDAIEQEFLHLTDLGFDYAASPRSCSSISSDDGLVAIKLIGPPYYVTTASITIALTPDEAGNMARGEYMGLLASIVFPEWPEFADWFGTNLSEGRLGDVVTTSHGNVRVYLFGLGLGQGMVRLVITAEDGYMEALSACPPGTATGLWQPWDRLPRSGDAAGGVLVTSQPVEVYVYHSRMPVGELAGWYEGQMGAQGWQLVDNTEVQDTVFAEGAVRFHTYLRGEEIAMVAIGGDVDWPYTTTILIYAANEAALDQLLSGG